ncbi:MAG: UvrD-helicase domain-containing protein [Planctomycetota bacterium]
MARANPGDPEPDLPHFSGHGVLEASAGTGKTYTIVQLVLDMLRRGVAELPQLLVLTFTEQAASELRERIREGLVGAVRDAGPDHRATFVRALRQFQEATISTIHGFCFRALQEFGFENGLPFRLTVVDDPPLLAEALHEVQRREWPRWFGPDLPDVLAISKFPGSLAGGAPAWEGPVLKLAARLQPGVELRPRDEPIDWLGILRRWQEALRPVLDLRHATAAASAEERTDELCADLDLAACFLTNTHAAICKTFQLAEHVAARLAESPPSGPVPSLLAALPFPCTEKGEYLRNRVKKAAPPQVCQQVGLVASALETVAAEIEQLQQRLAARTVIAMRDLVRVRKLERGWVSFDDMLALVAARLADPSAEGASPDATERASPDAAAPSAPTPPRESPVSDRPAAAPAPTGVPPFLAALRARYTCALVDEFQDTDPIQWNILRRIFVETAADPTAKNHRLIIVGDPKQSIYRFRGADVQSYLEARHQLAAGSEPHPLNVNWRSTPDLIAALNRLFAGAPDAGVEPWFPPVDGIEFQPVQPPGPSKTPRSVIREDRTDRQALTLCRLTAPDRGGVALRRWKYARFIAGECRRLLENGGRLVFAQKGGAQPADRHALAPRHLCILVSSRKSIGLIQRALTAAGLASTTYKQGGLWQSDEALELLYVLEAIDRSGDRKRLRKALLTRFFGYPPEALVDFDGFDPGHPVQTLLDRCAGWALRRRFSRLFGALVEETGVTERDLAQPGGVRRVANRGQLIEALAADAYGRSRSLTALVRRLRGAVTGAGDDPDDEAAGIQRIDSDDSRIRIMTVHAAKGLEFPVVFLFENARSPRNRIDFTQFHEDRRPVFDLTRSEPGKGWHRDEEAGETLRLTYVAATRAKFKLYLPVEVGDKIKPESPDGRVSRLFPVDRTGLHAGWIDADIPPEAGSHADSPAPVSPAAAVPLLEARTPDPNLGRRRIWIESFTRLRTLVPAESPRGGLDLHALPAAPVPVFGESDPRGEDEPWRRESALLEPAPTTPDGAAGPEPLAGREFGTLLHTLLESIDFAAVGQAASPAQLDPALRAHIERETLLALGASAPPRDIDRTLDAIARLLWNALHTPLPLPGGGFRLADLPPADRIHELEFQYPAPGAPAGSETFLHGFVDLVFRRPGPTGPVYFLLDWKTNRLDGGYAPDALARSMTEENYLLQQRIYTWAVATWLQTRIPDFNFDRHFGGAFYLYLRGLNGRDADAGVFQAPQLTWRQLAHQQTRLAGAPHGFSPDSSPRGARP